jgi:hypothetical protein
MSTFPPKARAVMNLGADDTLLILGARFFTRVTEVMKRVNE